MDLEKQTPADSSAGHPALPRSVLFIRTMAEKLGAAARAATIYGEPVERNGITVIPVAKVRWGFGGGAGQRNDGDGAGGGGGAQVSPVGFIEISQGRAEFRPIKLVSPAWIVAGGLAAILLLKIRTRK